MASHRLWGTRFEKPAEVVRWFGAMQAQEYGIARWSIGQRTRAESAAAVDRALRDGTIVRTHIVRPTWHFVLAADLRWLLVVSAPRVHALNAYPYRLCGIDGRFAIKTQRVLARALEGGNELTRVEIGRALERAGIEASGLRLGYVLMRAELDGVIVSGALRSKQRTYAAFDERVPPAPAVDADWALGELTRRYFVARGPATVRDYARWASHTLREARRGLEVIQPSLEREETGGRTYFFDPKIPRVRVKSPVVDLVQCYDECIGSYSESRDVLRQRAAVKPNLTSGGFFHAILLDGHLGGHFRLSGGEGKLLFEPRFHQPLSRAESRALDAAVARYARFAGVSVVRK
jgi:hypothetical protein